MDGLYWSQNNQQRSESRARTAWVVQMVQFLDYCSTGMFFKQIRYVGHPLKHMGNARIKY